jgi:hypothetical protein
MKRTRQWRKMKTCGLFEAKYSNGIFLGSFLFFFCNSKCIGKKEKGLAAPKGSPSLGGASAHNLLFTIEEKGTFRLKPISEFGAVGVLFRKLSLSPMVQRPAASFFPLKAEVHD